MSKEAKLKPNYSKVNIREIEINLKSIDDNFDEQTIKIFEIRPNQNFDKVKPALIYFHGGGACVGNADNYTSLLVDQSLNNDIVIYNVDYRLAPE